jgi:sec-independent protein translocase protein TatC
MYLAESRAMGLVGHLEELRRRILICLVVFGVFTVFLFSYGHELLAFLEIPALGTIREFVVLRPTEAVVSYFKVVLLGAFIVTFPFLVYETGAFLSPAFSALTRRRILGWLVFALVLFFTGIIFSYIVLLPAAFKFLITFGAEIARPVISLGEYVSFAVVTILLGGIVFEIPCVMGLLAETGLVRSQLLRAGRRYALLVIFIIAAVITPTQDVVNLLLFAVPMALLYEAGILLVRLVEFSKRNTPEK